MCHSKNSVLYYHGDTSEEESDWIADQIIKLHKKISHIRISRFFIVLITLPEPWKRHC